MRLAAAIAALLLAGCISTDLTAPDGTTVHRVAVLTNIGTIHATSTRAADGTSALAIDEEQVDQETALVNALVAALKARTQ